MIEYKNGNLLDSSANIICHQVNCKGVMGSGIAEQIKEQWPGNYVMYRGMCKESGSSLLGNIVLYPRTIVPNYYLCNIFGQDGYGRDKQYTDYSALKKALVSLNATVKRMHIYANMPISVDFPYGMGCGLGGGNWDIVKEIIKDSLDDSIFITIWKYKGK